KQLKPILHARDHGHGGADPIHIVWEDVGTSGGSGTSGLPWAVASRRNITLASSNTNTTVDFDTSNISVKAGSDGGTTFTLNAILGGNHGIQINVAGTYLWSVDVQMGAGASPAANSVCGVLSNLDTGQVWSGHYYEYFVRNPAGTSYRGHCNIVGWFNADPVNTTMPQVALCSIQQNSGASISGVGADFKIVKISPLTSPNFF